MGEKKEKWFGGGVEVDTTTAIYKGFVLTSQEGQ